MQKKAIPPTATVDLTMSPITFMVADDAFYFVLDSGSTEHIIKCPRLASDFKTMTDPINLNLAKQGTSVLASRRGDFQMQTDQGMTINLLGVLFVYT